MSEPCFKCGAARSCRHRTVDEPVVAPPKLQEESKRGPITSRSDRSNSALFNP